MKLAVVDDDEKTTILLESYIKRFEQEKDEKMNVSIFYNPNDFLTNYSKDYDLILMDIEMPGLNGIETAKELRRMDSGVVLLFITNMAQFAIHGYEVGAIDFVVKPVSYADFSMKIQKAMRYVMRDKDKSITIHAQEGDVHLYLSDVYYIEVIRHYLLYHTMNGNYTTKGVMKDMESQLAQDYFARCNYGYLVNLKYVESINGYSVKVNGDELQISRNRRSEFIKKFAIYLGGTQV